MELFQLQELFDGGNASDGICSIIDQTAIKLKFIIEEIRFFVQNVKHFKVATENRETTAHRPTEWNVYFAFRTKKLKE